LTARHQSARQKNKLMITFNKMITSGKSD